MEAIAESSNNITDPKVFDVYRSFLKYSESLPPPAISKLWDSIVSGMQAELQGTTQDLKGSEPEDYMMHRTPLEMYAFLLQHIN